MHQVWHQSNNNKNGQTVKQMFVSGTYFTTVSSGHIFCKQLGKGSVKKNRLLSGIAQISEPPTPQFGQLSPLFSGRQNDVLRV